MQKNLRVAGRSLGRRESVRERERGLAGRRGSARLGVFRTIDFAKKVGDKNYATHGETFVCAIEFAEKQNAQCSLSYGNFSQPGSIHLEDQLPLMVAKKLHPVWRERKEIEANLEKREKF
jgi:acyl-homoserine-lactone acylase